MSDEQCNGVRRKRPGGNGAAVAGTALPREMTVDEMSFYLDGFAAAVRSEPRAQGVTGTEARVCQDIAARQAVGLRKYGVTVELNPLDLRRWLRHAYEECLDQAVYLRRCIEELDKQGDDGK